MFYVQHALTLLVLVRNKNTKKSAQEVENKKYRALCSLILSHRTYNRVKSDGRKNY